MRTALFLTTIADVTWFAARKSPVTRFHLGQLVILLGLLTAAAALLGSVARSFQRDATSSFEFMASLPDSLSTARDAAFAEGRYDNGVSVALAVLCAALAAIIVSFSWRYFGSRRSSGR